MAEDMEKLDREITYLKKFQKNVREVLETVSNDYARKSMKGSIKNLGRTL